jgi:hypothetical protein
LDIEALRKEAAERHNPTPAVPKKSAANQTTPSEQEKIKKARFFYCNVAKNHNRVHDILACNRWDVVFIVDSPWYCIGRNHRTSNKENFQVFGTVANEAYQLYTASDFNS